ncbi:MAG: hypothetical protein COU51_02560 [Parcubacteria group bacterium CG10_big_fil_rev_8_21_14_0_10_36_14]|nr:MAG: hypothetical protein COU51_02560 [Parcubacteria group bacterium CG10_big_fil_rev_8_21_14_0_10_36_14]
MAVILPTVKALTVDAVGAGRVYAGNGIVLLSVPEAVEAFAFGFVIETIRGDVHIARSELEGLVVQAELEDADGVCRQS